MSVVVERGLARCPRCVAVADYTFVESGPNSVRYEVHCAKCGEAYSEVNTPVAPDFSAAALAVVGPIPGPVHRDVGIGRARVRAHLASLRAHAWAVIAASRGLDWRTSLRRRRVEPPAPLPPAP